MPARVDSGFAAYAVCCHASAARESRAGAERVQRQAEAVTDVERRLQRSDSHRGRWPARDPPVPRERRSPARIGRGDGGRLRTASPRLMAFAGGALELGCASCVRDFTSSLRNALCRWYSTVLGLMNSWAAISRLVCPFAARRAIWVSWGVSWSSVSAVRLRARSPVASSSRSARRANASAPMLVNALSAVCKCSRASRRRRSPRSHSP